MIQIQLMIVYLAILDIKFNIHCQKVNAYNVIMHGEFYLFKNELNKYAFFILLI